jgi:hypothetical protein
LTWQFSKLHDHEQSKKCQLFLPTQLLHKFSYIVANLLTIILNHPIFDVSVVCLNPHFLFIILCNIGPTKNWTFHSLLPPLVINFCHKFWRSSVSTIETWVLPDSTNDRYNPVDFVKNVRFFFCKYFE